MIYSYVFESPTPPHFSSLLGHWELQKELATRSDADIVELVSQKQNPGANPIVLNAGESELQYVWQSSVELIAAV
jgi:hypothetical protein